MADASATPIQGDGGDGGETPSGFNLQIVSPSASVRRPLTFPGIAASTTVRQLKEKIRESVASGPADDQQRLIHRGRLLAREEDTLESILGAEAIRSGEQQTLHLVLRDLSEPAPVRDQSPAPGNLPQQRAQSQQPPRPHQHPHQHQHQHPQQHPHGHRHIHEWANPHLPYVQPIPPHLLVGIAPPPMQPAPLFLPAGFQPNGHLPPAGVAGPATHEQLVNQAQQMMAQMMNQNQQRAGTPVGGARASSNPPPNGRDPNHAVAQLSSLLTRNAQAQEHLANQAEQITVLLSNPATAQPNQPPATQQFVNHGNMLLHQNNRLMEETRRHIEQNQRERAAAGLHGIQDQGRNNIPAQARDASGRNSPAVGQGTTVTREMIGPNGQIIRMTTTTVNGQVITQNGQPVPAVPGRVPALHTDIQNLLRGAVPEATQATQAMTNAMHRSASGASLANMANPNAPVQPIAPGVTTSIFQNPSRNGSRTATPDPSRQTPGHGNTTTAASTQPAAQRQAASQGLPEVYILLSPSGPQALLVTDQGTFITPQQVRQVVATPAQHQHPGFTAPQAFAAPHQQAQGPQPRLPPAQNQLRQRHHAQGLDLQHLVQPAAAAAANGQVQPAIDIHQHRRPPNVGVAALLAALWPHIWLLIRLAIFVWWFTAADSSWSRWIIVVLIAVGVFAHNTGLFNGIAQQAWDPFRRHLEGLLLPAAANPNPNAAPPPQDAARQADTTNGQNRAPQAAQQPHHANNQPDPAEAAARLVARRQHHNANWVMDHIRGVERAALLFLASIAPGVAERHIARLEEQERAARQERERLEAEAAAAAQAAQAQEAAAEGVEGG
ncbi:hypothetical protein GE09DRAFT_1124507 [Coniochaeta sp. 2T2.1]|nr:hypothetical protein GE09DRAFT_1124507 [Coniochaeta sp. 2T2.1]